MEFIRLSRPLSNVTSIHSPLRFYNGQNAGDVKYASPGERNNIFSDKWIEDDQQLNDVEHGWRDNIQADMDGCFGVLDVPMFCNTLTPFHYM